MLDRIDIHVEVPPLKYRELASDEIVRESARVASLVDGCRAVQEKRFRRSAATMNARMTAKQIKKHCRLRDGADALLKQAVDEFGISARAYTRILKVGRTIADLDGSEDIAVDHVAEAVQYRMPHSDIWE
jgi:magnesium chelatase family protein